MAAKFEVISKYADAGLPLPVRKTAESAGYDFVVAEDTIVPSHTELMNKLFDYYMTSHYDDLVAQFRELTTSDSTQEELDKISSEVISDLANTPLTLDEIGKLTKATGCKPTLVPTGMKCKLDPGTFLEISVRSSCPLKYWLVLANGVGKLL